MSTQRFDMNTLVPYTEIGVLIMGVFSMSISCATIVGIDCERVDVEVDIASGLPTFIIVGLPGTAVRESRDRVRSAIKRSGFAFPRTRVTVNLAPASARKDGSFFDLPIALAILHASGDLPKLSTRDFLFGELGLDGAVRPVTGALPLAIFAKRMGFARCILPYANVREVASVRGMKLVPIRSLRETVDILAERAAIPSVPVPPIRASQHPPLPHNDMQDIRGQQHAKRALEIAASGGHNLAMIGSPGSGKTMLARALPSILPPLDNMQALETGQIHSIARLLKPNEGISHVPSFRAPHHSSSAVSLIGGGSQIVPGEISLAHNGVLFLDELLEFSRHTLEHLREPLEEGCVRISRASGTAVFPARFQLVAAMNPCPCGFAMDETRECECPDDVTERYRRKLSGPLLDRIDIVVNVPRIPAPELHSSADHAETSEAVRARVRRARDIQQRRFSGQAFRVNKNMSHKDIAQYCALSANDQEFFFGMAEQLKLTTRRMFALLKIARSIADLAGSKNLTRDHCAESLSFVPRI